VPQLQASKMTNMNHNYLIRLILLKRPGFQSQKYGMPTSHSNIIKTCN